MAHDADLASIRRILQHGVVVRGRAVVGCWYAYDCRSLPGFKSMHVVEFGGLARTPCGRMAGFVDLAEAGTPLAPRAHHMLDAAVASVVGRDTVPEHIGQGVGQAMAELLEMLGPLAWLGMAAPGGRVHERYAGRGRNETLRGMPEALGEHLATMAAAVRPFVDTLDPEARDVSWLAFHDGDDGSRQVAGRHYAAMDRTFDPEAPLARALRTRPEVPRSVIDAWDEGRFDPAAVDGVLERRWATRHALPRRLADRTAEAGRTLDAMRSRGLSGLHEDCPDDVDPALAILFPLMRFPASWTPGTAEGWQAFASLHDVVIEASRMVGGRQPLDALLDAGHGWAALARRLKATSGMSTSLGVRACVADVDDHVQGYVTEVLVPALRGSRSLMPNAPSLHVARRLLLSGRGLPRILETSIRWHERREALRDALRGLGDLGRGVSWPACYPPHDDGTLRLEVLVDAGSLDAEGASGVDPMGMDGLSHCVGGYAGLCRAGISRVASIRDAGGRVSTAEFRLGPDGRPWLRQHRGRLNADPSPDAMEFIGRYLDLIRDGLLHFVPDDLCPDTGLDVEADHGAHDWNDPVAWEAARDLWDPFLPRRMRGLARDDLARLAVAVARDAGGERLGWRPDPVDPAAWLSKAARVDGDAPAP